ncbi:MAG: glycosyltransferase, partial [Gammaproteobacteria bacterium]|nr:glycosyltransferase [Gammaproteobacteria bacterium]
IGCREAVTDGDNGLLIPPRNPEALAEAIERLLSDAVLRRRLAKRGRERAEREFAAPVVIGKTLALYGDMLTQAAAPVRA